MRFLFVLLAVGFASLSIAAASEPESAVETCVVAANDAAARRACIGQVSAACMDDDEDGGVTTMGMVMCADRERQQWAALRDTASAMLRNTERTTQIAALDRALSAHAEWTRERCAYDASMYEGGSLAIYAAAACAMGQTADLALMLHVRAYELEAN